MCGASHYNTNENICMYMYMYLYLRFKESAALNPAGSRFDSRHSRASSLASSNFFIALFQFRSLFLRVCDVLCCRVLLQHRPPTTPPPPPPPPTTARNRSLAPTHSSTKPSTCHHLLSATLRASSSLQPMPPKAAASRAFLDIDIGAASPYGRASNHALLNLFGEIIAGRRAQGSAPPRQGVRGGNCSQVRLQLQGAG